MKESVAPSTSSERARSPLAARIRIADEAVGRVAAFPIETLAVFAAPKLAAMISELRRTENDLRERATGLLEELFQAISKASDKPTRTWLLEVKRTVYNGTNPWRGPSSQEQQIAESIGSILAQRLNTENQERRRVTELRERLVAAYESELKQQYLALHTTTQSPQFARALSLANPALAARWRELPDDAPRTKRTRHLERAVLHYLLRAVGRTTPSDAWAGVARIRLSDSENDLESAPAAMRCVAAPELLPFREIVEQLAQRARYLEEYPLRIDPAAYLDGDRWWGIGADGEWSSVPNNPLISAVTKMFECGGAGSPQGLIDLLTESAANTERLRELVQAVEKLIYGGVLRSSLSFPAAPSSAWQALELVGPQLLEPERSAWLTAIERCRRACSELTSNYENHTPESISSLHEDVRLAVAELANQVGVDTHCPAQMIKLDRTVPLEVRWSSRLMKRMRDAVVAVLEFHAQAGAAEVFRRELLASLRGSTRILADLVRTQPDLDSRATRAGLARFKEWTESAEDEKGAFDQCGAHADEARPGPYGTLMFILGGDPITPYFTWGRSTPDFASSRAYELLDRNVHDLQFVSALHPNGLQPLEVIGIDAVNPNATIRLESRTSRELGRHDRTIASFSKLEVEVDQDGRPWLRLPDENNRFVPTYSAPAGIGVSDPAGRFLVRLAMAHGWEFISFGVPVAAIVADVGGNEPVPVNISRSVPGLQQWILPAHFVSELRRKKGIDQYCQWREAIDLAGVGEWVWVGPASRPDAPRVLVRTDSPLLVSVVLERLSEDCGSLALTSVPQPALWPVKDAEDNHYLCELAVTWADSEHWSEVCR